jgi:hypothetical protein
MCHKKGCLAGGLITKGLMFGAKINCGSNGRSKQKINSTSGLFLTIIFRVSNVNLPIPSSLSAIKNLVFTATRKVDLFWLFANIKIGLDNTKMWVGFICQLCVGVLTTEGTEVFLQREQSGVVSF